MIEGCKMLNFLNDYSVLCHESVFLKLNEYKEEMNKAYGLDYHSERAKSLILDSCSSNESEYEIFFFNGGTQVNACAINSLLRHSEAVIAADSGHIANLEAGAIEQTGHKVELIKGREGKIVSADLEEFMKVRTNSEAAMHMVNPTLLYISQSTEYGTVYTEKELLELRAVCDRYDLKMYIDGARMASATMAVGAATLDIIAEVADAFTIGGTKAGAISGEALVIKKEALYKNFRSMQKQLGALAAKSYFYGLQFEALFEDGLYWRIGKKMNEQAKMIADGLLSLNYSLYAETVSNQVFVRLNENEVEKLKKDVIFEIHDDFGPNDKIVRLCTSFASTDEDCKSLLEIFSLMRA